MKKGKRVRKPHWIQPRSSAVFKYWCMPGINVLLVHFVPARPAGGAVSIADYADGRWKRGGQDCPPRSSRQYMYMGLAAGTVRAFKASRSKGVFLNKRIKGVYPCLELKFW